MCAKGYLCILHVHRMARPHSTLRSPTPRSAYQSLRNIVHVASILSIDCWVVVMYAILLHNPNT